MEGDTVSGKMGVTLNHFNPLPPHGGRRNAADDPAGERYFNPLPPHGGRPMRIAFCFLECGHFNPLPPHGGRLMITIFCCQKESFQSTPSAWRETQKFCSKLVCFIFQSTPSAWRETLRHASISVIVSSFQSTPSAWRETACVSKIGTQAHNFNPLPPHGGRRKDHPVWTEWSLISIHSLRMEGDLVAYRRRCL